MFSTSACREYGTVYGAQAHGKGISSQAQYGTSAYQSALHRERNLGIHSDRLVRVHTHEVDCAKIERGRKNGCNQLGANGQRPLVRPGDGPRLRLGKVDGAPVDSSRSL